MINAEFVKEHGKSFDEYLSSISDKYIDRWNKKLDQITFTEDQQMELDTPSPMINIVVFSAEWCPDCQAGVTVIGKFAESAFINVHIIDRDEHLDELENYKIAGGKRVPVILFMDTEFREVNRWIERSTFTYKLVADAKKEAKLQGTDDYKQFIRKNFKTHSKKMLTENITELFDALKRAKAIVNSSASLEEIRLKQPIVQN